MLHCKVDEGSGKRLPKTEFFFLEPTNLQLRILNGLRPWKAKCKWPSTMTHKCETASSNLCKESIKVLKMSLIF